ncbi:TRAP-type C4-dicarboxylate transport system permease small subunit [Metapseudomonas resinovorans]|uniref:CHASE2 domain-containing protein n=1 Tax=Metapseudomonas resinovorans TaxID=53412 RepID=UPI003D1F2875
MPEEAQTTHRHSTPGHRLTHFFRHLLHHLPGALIVSSLVAIGHLQFHLLDAVDGYAFITIGNLSAVSTSANRTLEPKVAVVRIDQQSHEQHYRERSPLNRCELMKDLGDIYNGRKPPKLVVIDLDLSPSPLLREARASLPTDSGQVGALAAGGNEAACEEALYRLLERCEGHTRTVLMEPFDVRDPNAREETLKWKERMANATVAFGEASLPISFGLVTKVDCKADGLAAVAFQQYSPKQAVNCVGDEHSTQRFLINPRQYFTGLRASDTADLPSRSPWIQDQPEVKFRELAYELPVVFFGGGYGEGDTYLTPLGTMYGVEVHAAAYMSLVEPASDFNHFLGFILELLLALTFGMFISWSWRKYFHLRFSEESTDRQSAPYLVVLLSFALLVLVVLATVVSLYLLGNSDYWLSPIPIAFGMFIESYFTGAVHQAVEAGHTQRQELIDRLEDAHWHGEEAFTARIANERKQQPPEIHSLSDRFWRFLILDVVHQIRKPGSAILLLIRRLTFFAILGWALYLTFH